MNDNKKVAQRTYWGRRDPNPNVGERPTAIRPANCQTALQWLRRKALCLLCPECGQVASVVDVIDISDAERSYTADVQLGCGHQRNHTVAVSEKYWK
jgi:hypothetical protein